MLRSIRVRFVASLVFICAGALALGVFTVALFMHRQGAFRAGMIILAIALVGQAVTAGARIWLVLYLGRWIGLNQKLIWRKEQPARFWALTTIYAIFAVIYLAAALFLLLGGAGLVS
jgi:hypothetical protein